MMINRYFFIVITSLWLVACQQQDNALTVISLGGIHAKAQQVAFYKPFENMNNVSIISGSYNGEMAKIRSMVETNQVDWDVVQVESANLVRGCSEGLFEPLNSTVIGNPNDFIHNNFSECGVGFFTWSIIVAYDTNKLINKPQSWQDFWDVKNFPGYRGLQKTPMVALEAALLADGVNPKDIYEVLASSEGVDKAFKKLDELKPYIKWWDKGSQPIPMLLAGDVVMTTTFNGRAVIARDEGKPVGLMWHHSFYDTDNYAIVKGTTHKPLAEQFIVFALTAVPQKNFSDYSHYGLVNKKAIAIIDPIKLKDIPNHPDTMNHAYKLDANFWVEQGEVLTKRFDIWAAQK